MAYPGSKYTSPATHTSFPANSSKVNPITQVQIHKQNPKGVPCDNTACSGLPCLLTHNHKHCHQPGGGMEGKAPWAQQGDPGKQAKKEVAATTAEGQSSSNASPTSPDARPDEVWQL
ncbi:hypothetical protein BDR04DRAFT_1123846, partial [Suillus decipiens]